MILVSACLTGLTTRYNGGSTPNLELMAELAGQKWIAICPEQLGGLSTPRPPAWLEGGTGADVIAGRARVRDKQGRDVTAGFLTGSRAVLDLALCLNTRVCYLKDRSPSCGVTAAGGASGLQPGPGVLAALLAAHGIKTVEIKAR